MYEKFLPSARNMLTRHRLQNEQKNILYMYNAFIRKHTTYHTI